jgi:segregation and condensation protein B
MLSEIRSLGFVSSCIHVHPYLRVILLCEVRLLEDQELKSAIEAVLFIAGNPLSMDRLKGLFEEASLEQIEAQIAALRQDYDDRGAGIMLAEIAGGHQLVTRPEHAAWLRKFRSVKVSSKLSKPALETLAIVAYKQPITRAEAEAIRGVNIGGIMRNLMERRLVKIVGKKDVPGKPMLYGTTPEFLQYFGLRDLSALPTLKEFQELEAGEEVMEKVTNVEDADSSEEYAAADRAAADETTETDDNEPIASAVSKENVGE